MDNVKILEVKQSIFASNDEQAAALAGTIPYELLCNVNPRVPRIYTGRGE
mgnify:FL=1